RVRRHDHLCLQHSGRNADNIRGNLYADSSAGRGCRRAQARRHIACHLLRSPAGLGMDGTARNGTSPRGLAMLAVQVEKTLGDAFFLRASFTSTSRATALFGASGAGKTSVINMIAGLMKPDRGRIELDGEVLFNEAERIDLPAFRRRIGYVFQEG